MHFAENKEKVLTYMVSKGFVAENMPSIGSTMSKSPPSTMKHQSTSSEPDK
ncbi:hypothetical protein C942_02225 [Photobacterium marinum]|uniref:Uncharacterized protein n=1 Tax=Photobacterium marinum TaxID=1056511 RepID=L8JAS8_9GAMM|nr:hypothetical protein [Photobacterium marinum]ELR64654.1 hypothetical protein C942_02225 [Photobacterium marinum]